MFACDKLNLFLILPKPLIFALATLHILFIRIPKFNLLSMVNPSNFTDFGDSIVLLFIENDLLIVFLLRIMDWNFPGLAIICLSSNHFNAIFRSDWRFSITTLTNLAQLYMVLSSAKLEISVFLTNYNMSFKKILKSNGPRIDTFGTLRRIFNHKLKVESSLTLNVRLEGSLVKV